MNRFFGEKVFGTAFEAMTQITTLVSYSPLVFEGRTATTVPGIFLLMKLDTLLLKVEMITIFHVHLQENSLHRRVMCWCCNPQFWTHSQEIEMLLRYVS